MEDLKFLHILKRLDIPDDADVYIPDNEALSYAAKEFGIAVELMLSTEAFVDLMQDCVNPQNLEIWEDDGCTIVEGVTLLKSIKVGNVTFHLIDGLLIKFFKLNTLKWFDQG